MAPYLLIFLSSSLVCCKSCETRSLKSCWRLRQVKDNSFSNPVQKKYQKKDHRFWKEISSPFRQSGPSLFSWMHTDNFPDLCHSNNTPPPSLQQVVSAVRAGVNPSGNSFNQTSLWDISSSFFFAGTVITTIGEPFLALEAFTAVLCQETFSFHRSCLVLTLTLLSCYDLTSVAPKKSIPS